MSTPAPRENPEAGTRAAKKQAMQARLKKMEVERLKMNTFLKESGYVRHPVAEDGDCCYLAILGSLGVLPPGEVANPGSNSLRAVKVLREMAYASVTGTSILDEADLEAFHESIPSHFVRKNSRNKNDVKNMDKRGDIFTKLLEYHIPLGRWKDSLSLQPFMVAGAGWWLQCDIYSISMAHGVANMVTTNSRVTFNDEKQSFEPMPNPGPPTSPIVSLLLRERPGQSLRAAGLVVPAPLRRYVPRPGRVFVSAVTYFRFDMGPLARALRPCCGRPRLSPTRSAPTYTSASSWRGAGSRSAHCHVSAAPLPW